MEDQFHNRTDDDLFMDEDFEPVDGEAVPSVEPKTVLESYIESQQLPAPEEPAPIATDEKSTPLARRKPGKTLANSRFASMPDEEPKEEPETETKKEKEPRQRAKRQPKQQKKASGDDGATADTAASADAPSTPASNGIQIKGRAKAEKAKAEQSKAEKGKGDKQRQENKRQTNKKKPDGDDVATEAKTKPEKKPDTRSMSGANPRNKLTEEEITAKMQKMKVVAEEKSRQFDKATQDEKQHNEAYAKGMAKNLEEARKRREQEQARRRKADEERKELEAERAKNRERKRRAMNHKEGSWDDGKQNAINAEQRQTFRGANGGIRGGRGGSGLGASRFSAGDGAHGGRRGSDRGGGDARKDAQAEKPEPKPVLRIEDFPALPEFEPGGNWGDEMEEFDEMNKTKPSTT